MDILKHPLFLLAVSAVITGIFIPWLLRRRQYKQQELELKTEIVSDLTESVMKFITTIYLFKTRKKEMQKRIDEDSLEKELSKTLKDWEVRSCVICTKLQSYFPEEKKGEQDLSDDFKDLFDEIYASKEDIEDIKKEIEEKDLKGKWDMFKAVLNKFYERKGAINKEKFDYIKKRLFEWKHEIIQKIFASTIKEFSSQRIGEILTKGGEKMKWKIKTGLLLIVIGIGIPIVSYFFVGSPTYNGEGKLIPNEIMSTIEERAKKLEKMREDGVKERDIYRHEEEKFIRWMIEKFEEAQIVKSKEKSHIPYNYFIGIGFILFFIGIGIIVLSLFHQEKNENKKKNKKREE